MRSFCCHLGLIVYGTMEVLFFGGIIFGWASLVYVYKNEQFFASYCQDDTDHFSVNIDNSSHYLSTKSYQESVTDSFPNVTTSAVKAGRCEFADKQFNLIYTLAVAINGLGTFINGLAWDKFGTRIIRSFSIILYITGLGLAALSSTGNPFLLYPSMILIAYGGYIILMTNFQLGSLFPNKRSTIISLYCGAYDSSAVMLLLAKVFYDIGLPVSFAFVFLIGLFSVVVFSTFFILPKTKLAPVLPADYRHTVGCVQLCPEMSKDQEFPLNDDVTVKNHSDDANEGQPAISVKCDVKQRSYPAIADKDNADETKPLESSVLGTTGVTGGKTFQQEALSMLFVLDVVWLTLMRFQSWSFIGRLNLFLDYLTDSNKDTVGRYLTVYAFMQFWGIFLAPLSGLLMDRKKNRQCSAAVKRIELIEVCIASFVIDTTAGLLLAVMAAVPVLQVQYASFVLHVVHRALLYGPNSAFIAQVFTAANFGKLFGLAMTISAAFSLIQYPLFALVSGTQEGNPFIMNMIVLVFMVIAYGHPIYLWWWCRSQRRKLPNEE